MPKNFRHREDPALDAGDVVCIFLWFMLLFALGSIILPTNRQNLS